MFLVLKKTSSFIRKQAMSISLENLPCRSMLCSSGAIFMNILFSEIFNHYEFVPQRRLMNMQMTSTLCEMKMYLALLLKTLLHTSNTTSTTNYLLFPQLTMLFPKSINFSLLKWSYKIKGLSSKMTTSMKIVLYSLNQKIIQEKPKIREEVLLRIHSCKSINIFNNIITVGLIMDDFSDRVL